MILQILLIPFYLLGSIAHLFKALFVACGFISKEVTKEVHKASEAPKNLEPSQKNTNEALHRAIEEQNREMRERFKELQNEIDQLNWSNVQSKTIKDVTPLNTPNNYARKQVNTLIPKTAVTQINQPYQRTITKKYPCFKCNSTGYLPQYDHIENGVCFDCSGSGEWSPKKAKALPNIQNKQLTAYQKKYPCFKCNSTGRLLQYKHIEGGKCFACNGSGQWTPPN